MSKKGEFRKFIVDQTEGLSKDEQRNLMEDYIDVIKSHLASLGVGLLVQKGTKPFNENPSFMDQFVEMLKQGLNKSEAMKTDETIKNIGDSVKLTDKYASHYMHEFETKEACSNIHKEPIDLTAKPAIVIAIDVNYIFNCGGCDEKHESDLLIYFPDSNKKYYINSRLVKIL